MEMVGALVQRDNGALLIFLRHGREIHLWQQVPRRELQIEAQQIWYVEHGQFWQRHQRIAILHYHSHYLVSQSISIVIQILIACHSWLDGKHVVFGEVLEGYDVVEKVEDVPKGPGDKPTAVIKIAKSGELEKPDEGTHAEL